MDLPIAVMPLHDPEGVLFPHLERVTPLLGQLFGEIIMRITAPTRSAQPEWLHWLEGQDHFHIMTNGPGGQIGQQFCELYHAATSRYASDQILHLCFPDRIAYALGSEHCEHFVADIKATRAQNLPLLFQRSEHAWSTHPKNCRVMENLATQVGELVLGRSLDLTWCHMVMLTGQLQRVLPYLTQSNLSVLAEILFPFADEVTTKDVDWLAWEDPFIVGSDAANLKQEREHSLAEIRKRLSYVIPTIEIVTEWAQW